MQIPQDILRYIEKQWKWDEDVKQDVLVEIIELPEGTTVNKSWCISRYESRRIDNIRQNENRARLNEEHAGEIMENFGVFEDKTEEDILDYLSAYNEIQTRLQELSPLLRETVEGIVLEGKTPEQIAEAEGTTANVIYKRIHDAKQILQGNKQ
jgi:DNA-directed RNA polymerase specialized sigma24 family protein